MVEPASLTMLSQKLRMENSHRPGCAQPSPLLARLPDGSRCGVISGPVYDLTRGSLQYSAEGEPPQRDVRSERTEQRNLLGNSIPVRQVGGVVARIARDNARPGN